MRTGLIGRDIAYSASPRIHAAAFAALGLDWTYELIDIEPGELARAVGRLRTPAWRGANVTIPYKTSVLGLLDQVVGEAAAAGSVNTVVNDAGRLIGYNTDVIGIRRAMARLDLAAGAEPAVVIGTGGSARAVLAALVSPRVTLVSRQGRGIEGYPLAVPIRPDDPALAGLIAEAAVLVNASPLGRNGEPATPVPVLPRAGVVIDLVYSGTGTPLISAARQAGVRFADGWEILVAQAEAAFELWTGLPAPSRVMWAAAGGGGDRAGLDHN